MMEGWNYCKLGDVCAIERGGSPRPIDSYITDSADGLNWIKIGDATEGSKFITHTKEKIRKEGLKKTRFVHRGDFILSNSMSFGKPYILGIDGCIHDGWLAIHDEANTFDKSFLYYLLSSPTMYREFKRLAVGGVVNNLNSQIVRDVVVAIPPRLEQERIVAELDLLTGIIDKQKAQLKELDTLAQSIFYDMFGDIQVNNKGWRIVKLDDICEITSSRRIYQSEQSMEGIPFYRISDLSKLIKEEPFEAELHIPTSRYNELLSDGQVPVEGDILITSRGTLGTCYIIKSTDCFYFQDGMISWLKNISSDFTPVFISHLFKDEYIQAQISSFQSGTTVAYLSLGMLKKFFVPQPPLGLQQSFAQKIQSIESQKASINRSIAETQKLFDSAMDKYFVTTQVPPSKKGLNHVFR